MKVGSNDWYSTMTGLTAEFASVKSTSYKKLVRKYYDTQKEQQQQTGASKEKNALLTIKSSADELVKEANALTSKGKFSVFNKQEDRYDEEAIKKSVVSFAENYNKLVESSLNTENTMVLRKTLTMVNTTKAYKKSLEKAGITVNSDNTLSIDEKGLEKAGPEALKRLFSGAVSYGAKIMSQAAGISSASFSSSLYAKSGSYKTLSVSSFSRVF